MNATLYNALVLQVALSMIKFRCSLKISLSWILIPSSFLQLLLLISVSPIFIVTFSLMLRRRWHLSLLTLIWLLENHFLLHRQYSDLKCKVYYRQYNQQIQFRSLSRRGHTKKIKRGDPMIDPRSTPNNISSQDNYVLIMMHSNQNRFRN